MRSAKSVSARLNRPAELYSHSYIPIVKDYPDVWLHVDAAWAGVTLACPEYRENSRLEDINKYATSVGTNLHKVIALLFRGTCVFVTDAHTVGSREL